MQNPAPAPAASDFPTECPIVARSSRSIRTPRHACAVWSCVVLTQTIANPFLGNRFRHPFVPIFGHFFRLSAQGIPALVCERRPWRPEIVRAFSRSEPLSSRRYFAVRQKLGSGSFGEIYLGVHTQTNELVAIKVVLILSA